MEVLDAQYNIYAERSIFAYGTLQQPYPRGLPHVRPPAPAAGSAAAGAAGKETFAYDFVHGFDRVLQVGLLAPSGA